MIYNPHARLREPRLLTAADVAKMLGVNPDTLRKWRKTGDGPQWCKIGSRYRYTPQAVQQYISDKGKQ